MSGGKALLLDAIRTFSVLSSAETGSSDRRQHRSARLSAATLTALCQASASKRPDLSVRAVLAMIEIAAKPAKLADPPGPARSARWGYHSATRRSRGP